MEYRRDDKTGPFQNRLSVPARRSRQSRLIKRRAKPSLSLTYLSRRGFPRVLRRVHKVYEVSRWVMVAGGSV